MFKKSFLKKIAKKESVSQIFLEKQLNSGRVIIPLNNRRDIENPVAVGEGVRVKINTNIGTTTTKVNASLELEKLAVSIKAGTDTVMDLSVGGNLSSVRKKIIANSSVAVGTVPIYEIAHNLENRGRDFETMTFDDIMTVLTKQASEGVDFFTIHAGILKKAVKTIRKNKRVAGIVSRGGALLARWMYHNNQENPLYENFDRILDLAKEYNISLSLGDALRPGAIADSTDELQIGELYVLGELVRRSRKRGVQVMVEGPGHIKLDEIAINMHLQKQLCDHAPFYILGPLPTDIASGYDHITSAIGGAIAALNGANFLCVVTPAEHLRHPTIEDIKDGVIASKIAAHSMNLLNFKEDFDRDKKISYYRARRDWESVFPLTIDEEKARSYRQDTNAEKDVCSMCGDFCSLKISEKCHFLK